MKILIIGDLHGSKPNISFKDFDAIVAPGDFCLDKGIREIYSISYQEFLKDPNNYREWWEICGKKKAKKLILDSVKAGRRTLEFLNSFGVLVFVVPGNWDWTYSGKERWDFLNKDFFKEYLIKGLKNIINLDGRAFKFGEFTFVGYGKSNGPELYKYRNYDGIMEKKEIEKNKKDYSRLLKKYNKLFRKIKSKRPIIFLSHNVPYNTSLDKITNKESLRYGYHYGSLISREMILKHKPLVSIGGHMHEHFGKCKLGRTTVINSGFGPKVNTFLEISDEKIKKLKFFRGK